MSEEETGKRLGRIATAVVLAVIILCSSAALVVIFQTEPAATQEAARKKTAIPVTIKSAEVGTYQPRIEAMGTVRPRREVTLQPQVQGQIIERASNFVPGGLVTAGETLLRLEPADYRHALTQRRSELRQAQADLQLAQGEQEVAKQDYAALDEELPAEQRALVLRQPQLETAQAQVDSAQAAVDQARLDLRRTRIQAPFDAQVISREVNVSSQVSPGDELARLVGTQTYWVEATVPVSKLPWISLPEAEQERGAPVRIRDRGAWPADTTRRGEVDRLIGSLSDDTRMARLLIAVDDPLGGAFKNRRLMPGTPRGGGLWRQGWRHEASREGFTASSTTGVPGVSQRFGVLRSSLGGATGSSADERGDGGDGGNGGNGSDGPTGTTSDGEQPRLLLGAYVACHIQGRPLTDVVRLEREYVREGDTAWIMVDGELDIRELSIRFRDSTYAYIDEGIESGERIVTSQLTSVREGTPLRLKDDPR